MYERISFLGKVLRPSAIPADLHTSHGFRQVKVRPGGQGIVQIKNQGRFTGKPQKIAQAGQFIISQFHPLKRLWGIVPSALDKVEIPPTYLVFDLDSALDPDYFAVFVTTGTFRQAVFEASRKSGRLYLREFRRICLPLPTRQEQNRIVVLARMGQAALEALETQISAALFFRLEIIAELLQQAAPSWNRTTLGQCVTITQTQRRTYPLVILPDGTILENVEIPASGGIGLDPGIDIHAGFLRYTLTSRSSTLAAIFKENNFASAIQSAATMPLLLPTLYEQQKMVQIFRLCDHALAALEIEHKALKEVLQRLLDAIFSVGSKWQNVLPEFAAIVARYR